MQFMQQAVRIAAGSAPGAAAALAPLYGNWVCAPAPGTRPQHLASTVWESLAGIEDRHLRCLRAIGSRTALTVPYLRWAALLDRLGGSRARIRQTDGLIESLLEAEIDPPALAVPPELESETWDRLCGDWMRLRALPRGGDVWQRHPADPSVDAFSDLVAHVAGAVALAAPGLWRFGSSNHAARGPDYRAALSAPRMAASLLNQLSVRAERAGEEDGVAEPGLENCRERLEACLADWLDRSQPELDDNAVQNPRYAFIRWAKHVRRAQLVQATRWRKVWFKSQLATTLRFGAAGISRLRDEPDPQFSGSTVYHYARLCLQAAELGWDPPDGQNEDWFYEQAEAVMGRLTPGVQRYLRASRRIRAAQANSESGVEWGSSPIKFLGGFLAQSPASHDGEDRWVREQFGRLREELTAPLALWATDFAEARYLGTEIPALPPEAWPMRGPAWVFQLVVDFRERSHFLADHVLNRQLSSDDVRAFLTQLDDAVFELANRLDPAIQVAIGDRLARDGRLDDADLAYLLAIAANKRPQNRALCEERIAIVTWRRSGHDASGRERAFRQFVKAAEIGAMDTGRAPESLSPLMRAASLANQTGWPGRAARCLARIRRARDSRGAPLDRAPERTNRLRRESVAIWLAARPSGCHGWTEHANLVMADALADMDSAQTDSARDQARGTVAKLLDAGVPADRLASYVRNLPAERLDQLYGLGIALQFHSPRIPDAVMEAAFARLFEGRDAMTLIGTWLVQRYFDRSPRAFLPLLEQIAARLAGGVPDAADLQDFVLRLLPDIVYRQVAARWTGIVSEVATRQGLQRQIERLAGLMDGGLLLALLPLGAGRYGSLVLADWVLEQQFGMAGIGRDRATFAVEAPRPAAVQAIPGFRTLNELRSLLRFGGFARVPGDHLAGQWLRHRTALRLEDHTLVVESIIIAHHRVENEAWSAAHRQLRLDLNNCLTRISGRSAAAATGDVVLDTAQDQPAMRLETRVTFYPPRPTTPTGAAARMLQLIDSAFSLHLARLSGIDQPGAPLRTPTRELHTARNSLEDLSRQVQAGTLDPTAAEQGAHDAIRTAVRLIPRYIRASWATRGAIVRETIIAAATPFGFTVPEAASQIAELRVGMPHDDFRFVITTLFENAKKAVDSTGGTVRTDISVEREMIVVCVDAPYVADYATGTGLGALMVQMHVAARFGSFTQQQSEDGSRWSARLALPLFNRLHVAEPAESELEDAAR